jgi:hypothetical protein
MGGGKPTRDRHVEQLAAPSRDPENLKMSNDSRADYGTDRLPGQRFPLPSERDCYDCANRCLDMWNDSVDHAAQSSLLRMADAWLQLASESNNSRRTEQPRGCDADRQPVVATDHHASWGCAGLRTTSTKVMLRSEPPDLKQAMGQLRELLGSEMQAELTTEYLTRLYGVLEIAERVVRAERWARDACEFRGE